MALEMLAGAWTATSAGLIQNCFIHAGFAAGQHASAALPELEASVSASGDDLQPLTEAWDALRSVDTTVPDVVELNDFLCADADLIVQEGFSDDAIIDSVRKEHEESDDEDGEKQKRERQPSSRDVLHALDVIRNFLRVHDGDEAMHSLSSCEAQIVKLMHSKKREDAGGRAAANCELLLQALGGGQLTANCDQLRLAVAPVQLANRGHHLFWVYENVAAMPRDCKRTISRFLECEPTLLDARFFSAQVRARYFWGNVPGMYSALPPRILERSVDLSSVLDPLLNRKALVEKIRTVTTRSNSLRQGKQGMLPVQVGERGADVLWITELERVFGFPSHYTDVGNLSLGRRQQLLGRAWSVPVVCHLLAPLRDFFRAGERRPPMREC
ncbi:hypothetical protein HPB47_016877 [Ixodes persulcatus]|uniref:Uncharacterized protein n=1 Tax=Ixodes persulcatus TaxID=34615 RepID=A0AC60QPQ9_IXOPE|nr:hypothetical protein HPB47_016877 [Ixodes persulcatus]